MNDVQGIKVGLDKERTIFTSPSSSKPISHSGSDSLGLMNATKVLSINDSQESNQDASQNPRSIVIGLERANISLEENPLTYKSKN